MAEKVVPDQITSTEASSSEFTQRILHECSCFIEFIKQVEDEACQAFYHIFATSLINSITQEQEC